MNGHINTGRDELAKAAVLTPNFNAQTIFADDVTVAERIAMARELLNGYGESGEPASERTSLAQDDARGRVKRLCGTVRPLRRAA